MEQLAYFKSNILYLFAQGYLYSNQWKCSTQHKNFDRHQSSKCDDYEHNSQTQCIDDNARPYKIDTKHKPKFFPFSRQSLSWRYLLSSRSHLTYDYIYLFHYSNNDKRIDLRFESFRAFAHRIYVHEITERPCFRRS